MLYILKFDLKFALNTRFPTNVGND